MKKYNYLCRGLSLFVAVVFMLSTISVALEAAVVTWLSPESGQVNGRYVDVSVGYNTESTQKVTKIELWIDGEFYSKKLMVNPATHGVVSFNWDTNGYPKGYHPLVVKIYSNSNFVGSASGTCSVGNLLVDLVPPTVKFTGIKDGSTIKGVTQINISAKDNSGNAPIVSLLVDEKLKLLKNTPPYTYDLDTTAYNDGTYKVETYAFDNDGNKSNPAVLNVKIINKAKVAAQAAPVTASTKTIAAAKPIIPAPVAAAKPSTAARTAEPVITRVETKQIASAQQSAPKLILKTLSSEELSRIKERINAAENAALKAPVVTQTKVADIPAKSSAPSFVEPVQANSSTMILDSPAVEATVVVKQIDTPKEMVLVAPASSPIAASTKQANVLVPTSEVRQTNIVQMASSKIAEPKIIKPSLPQIKPVVKQEKPIAPIPQIKKESKVIQIASAKVAEPKTTKLDIVKVKPVAKPVIIKKVEVAKVSPIVEKPKVSPIAPKTIIISPPVVKSNANALPQSGKIKVRDLMNKMDGTVVWDSKTKTVITYSKNVKIEMRIGDNIVKVNGTTMKVNMVPTIVNGRTVIDIRLYHKACTIINSKQTSKQALAK